MAANDQVTEQREPEEPAHHARRPMNAFLIFCKRHRGSVRLHFPHLENRAVTRVLGEWWATLHPDQKQSYINLAQEYKDAFLNANPDFKWYKLPAPPLRTLTTRPTNKKPDVGSSYEENSTSTSNSNYESSTYTNNESNNAIQPEVNSPEDGNFRSERSCKGLRYQKFLAEQVRNIGSTTQQNKRRRTGLNKVTGVEKHTKERRNSISSNVSEKTDSLSSEGGNSSRSDLEHLVDSAEGKVEASKPENTETDEAEYELWTRKRFKAEDFNLEKKIEALPSLSLEEFQEKKKQQRTKKKKLPQKLNTTSITKRTPVNQNKIGQLDSQANDRKETNEIINLHDETTNAHLVGSKNEKLVNKV
ncbi:hypothetical protein G9C98_007805 [Cotesia typhae]|uniref:HMG box domain-containing protein n=1 Tax=Cotesia typhae TaxID=2053667 RepID=A0A8J5V5T9_9HYME|nr:hypothetical protein G9C98_007805 [Cotesia typhae]